MIDTCVVDGNNNEARLRACFRCDRWCTLNDVSSYAPENIWTSLETLERAAWN